MRHARCLRRLDKDELEWFSTRCHLYNGTSIKKHSSVMASVRNTGDEASNVQTVALAGLVLAQRSQALTTLTFSVGEWNEILYVKTIKNISTRKELNTNHGTKELVEW